MSKSTPGAGGIARGTTPNTVLFETITPQPVLAVFGWGDTDFTRLATPAQTATPGDRLYAVDFLLNKDDPTPGTVQAAVWQSTPGAPIGAPVAVSQAIAANDLPDTPAAVRFTFPNGVRLPTNFNVGLIAVNAADNLHAGVPDSLETSWSSPSNPQVWSTQALQTLWAKGYGRPA